MPPPRFVFNRYQQEHFVQFLQFRMQMPRQHCNICNKLLYPEDVFLRDRDTYDQPFLSTAWGLEEAIVIDDAAVFIVCQRHRTPLATILGMH